MDPSEQGMSPFGVDWVVCLFLELLGASLLLTGPRLVEPLFLLAQQAVNLGD
jgi:hypothetical protein